MEKSKEELQKMCKQLKISCTGNKPELRRRIIEREKEKEAAAAFFKIKVSETNSPNKPSNNSVLPRTPSMRRTRLEVDLGNEGEEMQLRTPGKKDRKEEGKEDKMEMEARVKSCQGRQKKDPGRLVHVCNQK